MKGNVPARHYPNMRVLPCLLCLCAIPAWADEAADRAAVAKVVIAFNDKPRRPALLTRDADIPSLSSNPGEEVSQIYFEAKTVKLLTPDVAIVDADGSQYGSLAAKRVLPALFVMQRVGGEWRIAVLRLTTRYWH